MLRLSPNAIEVLRTRYLRRGPDGTVEETPEALFRRVARAIASAEQRFGSAALAAEWEERFHAAMANLEFLPNSPTLMNAGRPPGQLSACFVLPIDDTLDGVFHTLHDAAMIHRTGGGTGYNFSAVHPAADRRAALEGKASDVVAVLRIFNAATDAMRRGGIRRGASMAILDADHPDITAFIDAKRDPGALRNFNLSVGVTEAFMQAVVDGGPWPLRYPSAGRVVGSVDAAPLFRSIVEAAWATGDPGLVFLDALQRANPTPAVGRIRATNPCGEVPLLPYESCTLGSINLAACLVRQGAGEVFDHERFRALVRLGVRFLDDVVEVNEYPIPELERTAKANRKIGLGVMGLAETFIRLGLPYDSPEAKRTARAIAVAMREAAEAASAELAAERGVFPNWNGSIFAPARRLRRNATLLSIAPTGTLSVIAGTTSGIEPLFGVAFTRRHVLGGRVLPEVSALFARTMEARGLEWQSLIPELAKSGSVQGLAGVPDDLAHLLRGALDLDPLDHLEMQAIFQREVDNAVSKTVNLPADVDVGTVERVYLAAFRMGLKGVTVFRYGSRREQVLSLGTRSHKESGQETASAGDAVRSRRAGAAA
ncbi:MAG: adenosylcobalamin-dependent ribonucleoside-diphosphate reductase [Nitrospirota bacterium]